MKFINLFYLFIFSGRLETREQIQREMQYENNKNKHNKKIRKEHGANA